MHSETFTQLADTIAKTAALQNDPTCERLQRRLVAELISNGWRRSYKPYPLRWHADVYEKGSERIILDRTPGRAVESEHDLRMQVYSQKYYPLPTCLFHEKRWIDLIGRVTKKGMRMWFVKGECTCL